VAGAVKALDGRAAVAAVDPVVSGPKLKPRQRGVGGDGVDRCGEAVEVDAVDDAGDVHGELLAVEVVYLAGAWLKATGRLSTAREVVHQRLGLDRSRNAGET
jgi:hypothetical protein